MAKYCISIATTPPLLYRTHIANLHPRKINKRKFKVGIERLKEITSSFWKWWSVVVGPRQRFQEPRLKGPGFWFGIAGRPGNPPQSALHLRISARGFAPFLELKNPKDRKQHRPNENRLLWITWDMVPRKENLPISPFVLLNKALLASPNTKNLESQ